MSNCKHDWYEDDCKCCGFFFWECRKCHPDAN